MKEFTHQFMGFPIIARVIILSEGVNICLTGGTHEHIGAVSIISPSGDISTITFKSHKDNIISSLWAKTLLKVMIMPAVISVGIHYDNIDKEKINDILSITNKMLEEICMFIQMYNNI